MQSSDLTLWALAVLLYGVGDLLTTLSNFSVGMVELNPFNVFAVKAIVFLVGGVIYAKTREKIYSSCTVRSGIFFAVAHNVFTFCF